MPSATGTTRLPTEQAAADPPTAKLSTGPRRPSSAAPAKAAPAKAAPAKAANNATNAAAKRTQRVAGARKEREIESWLGDLRAPAENPPPARPSTEPTRAVPAADESSTTAIPLQRPDGEKADPEATEKLPTQGQPKEDESRRSGGVSAQDLLRREGRL